MIVAEGAGRMPQALANSMIVSVSFNTHLPASKMLVLPSGELSVHSGAYVPLNWNSED